MCPNHSSSCTQQPRLCRQFLQIASSLLLNHLPQLSQSPSPPRLPLLQSVNDDAAGSSLDNDNASEEGFVEVPEPEGAEQPESQYNGGQSKNKVYACIVTKCYKCSSLFFRCTKKGSSKPVLLPKNAEGVMKRLVTKYTQILAALNVAPMDSGGLAASGAAKKDQFLVPIQAFLDVKQGYDSSMKSKHWKNWKAFSRLELTSTENFLGSGEVDKVLNAKKSTTQQCYKQQKQQQVVGRADGVESCYDDVVEVEKKGDGSRPAGTKRRAGDS
eukprot:2674586-Rhodomonas_salina.1